MNLHAELLARLDEEAKDRCYGASSYLAADAAAVIREQAEEIRQLKIGLAVAEKLYHQDIGSHT